MQPCTALKIKIIIMIQNIVVRGEPTTAAKKGTESGPLAPKTIFKCIFGQQIGVYNNDPKGS